MPPEDLPSKLQAALNEALMLQMEMVARYEYEILKLNAALDSYSLRDE
jgi:hypothetical protein